MSAMTFTLHLCNLDAFLSGCFCVRIALQPIAAAYGKSRQMWGRAKVEFGVFGDSIATQHNRQHKNSKSQRRHTTPSKSRRL